MESGDHIKREEIETDETESDGFGYTLELGVESFFYYNVNTGDHIWPTNSSCSEKTIIRVQTSDVPPKASELCSMATQTEDNEGETENTQMVNEMKEEIRDDDRVDVNGQNTLNNTDVDNERQIMGITKMMNEIKEEIRGDDTVDVNGQNTLNNTDVDDNLDGVCEDFEIDESLSTIITEMKRRKRRNLKKRSQTRTCKKPLKCSYCYKTFGWKSDLDRHLRTHTGEKPFECSYCGKAFAKKCNRNTHLRTHTGEKPYECSYCDKAFVRKGDFNVHQRSHTGEKPYECSYCDRPFARKHNLKRHIRTHTGEKPFECLYCSKAYSQKRDLSRHLQLHNS